MDKEQLKQKIESIEKSIQSDISEGAKKVLRSRVEGLKADLKKLEDEEKKINEEKKVSTDLDDVIKRIEKSLASDISEGSKAIMRKKLEEAKEKKKQQEQEIKEDKQEAAQEMKSIRDAVDKAKALVSARKSGVRKTNKEKKEAAPKVEKAPKVKIKSTERVAKSKKRVSGMKSLIGDLERLINRNATLKAKYVNAKTGNLKDDVKRDAGRAAKPFGYRFVGKHDYRVPTKDQIKEGLKDGTIDYEGRPNRSDKYPKGRGKYKAKLADGGMAGEGDEIRASAKSIYDKKGFMGLRNTFLQLATTDEKSGDKETAELRRKIVKEYQDKQPKMMAKGGETNEQYVVWVSKDGVKSQLYGTYKSQRAAEMAMKKLSKSNNDYKEIGNKPKSKYEKEGGF